MKQLKCCFEDCRDCLGNIVNTLHCGQCTPDNSAAWCCECLKNGGTVSETNIAIFRESTNQGNAAPTISQSTLNCINNIINSSGGFVTRYQFGTDGYNANNVLDIRLVICENASTLNSIGNQIMNCVRSTYQHSYFTSPTSSTSLSSCNNQYNQSPTNLI